MKMLYVDELKAAHTKNVTPGFVLITLKFRFGFE